MNNIKLLRSIQDVKALITFENLETEYLENLLEKLVNQNGIIIAT